MINKVRLLQAKHVGDCAAHCMTQEGCTVFVHDMDSGECWWEWVEHDFECHKKQDSTKYNLFALTPGLLPYLAHTLHHAQCGTIAQGLIHLNTDAHARTHTHTYKNTRTHAHMYTYIHSHIHSGACFDCLQPLERRLTRRMQQASRVIGEPHAGAFMMWCMVAAQVTNTGPSSGKA